MRVLIVEDDRQVALFLRDEFRKKYSVDAVYTGRDALYHAHLNPYDLFIIDIGLPDMSGSDLCKQIRQKDIQTPILVLTAHSGEEYKVKTLDIGADDYVTKPFHLAELHARVRALLRRPVNLLPPILSVDALRLDAAKRTITIEGHSIDLRKKEFDLLEYLLRNKGRVVSRTMMLEHVWDEASDPYSNTVDVHIKNLRDRIEKPFSMKFIKTISGVGYTIPSNKKEKVGLRKEVVYNE
jgi:DNA-binding response OmpR family regulator